MDRNLGQGFDARSVFPQRIFYNAKIESGNDNVIPAIPDTAQRNVQHRDYAIA